MVTITPEVNGSTQCPNILSGMRATICEGAGRGMDLGLSSRAAIPGPTFSVGSMAVPGAIGLVDAPEEETGWSAACCAT